MIQRLLLFSLLVGCLWAQPQTPYAIDTLTLFQNVLRCDGGESMTAPPTMDASFLGNRVLSCSASGQPGIGLEVATRAVADNLICNIGSGATGDCCWDYVNIPSVDFRAIGCGCWDLTELAPDRVHNLRIEAWSGANMATSEITNLGPLNQGETRRVCIPLGGDLTVYDAVTRVKFYIDGTLETQLDNVIENFCCLPTTDSWHSVNPAGMMAPGECSQATFTISNTPREPMTTRTLNFEFPFVMGRITPSSLVCTGPGSVFIDGSQMDRRVFGTVTLPPGGTQSCNFEVCWDSEGSADLWLNVVDNGVTSNSNANGPREGTDNLCTPPVPSPVQIVRPPTTQPPTTLPPTTLPPTTRPPTTEPPTTDPPTTEPPTTAPPTTEPPTTDPPTMAPTDFICIAPKFDPATGDCECLPWFPCVMTGPTEFHCTTNEWYCIFIASNNPTEEYFVEYGPNSCSCFY